MTGALADRIDANERFAADVSHEIKNPLASIKSAVESARAAHEPAQQNQMLAIVAQDVQRLDRLDHRHRPRQPHRSGNRARRSRARRSRRAAARTGARLRARRRTKTERRRRRVQGPKPDGAIVLGQEGPLGQVFRNLIDNARSFSPRRRARHGVGRSVPRAKDGRVVRAMVEDEGPGIPPENLETVFERFYTQRPKGAAFGGNSGLGLSIARQIVTAHGGRIYAQNRRARAARA